MKHISRTFDTRFKPAVVALLLASFSWNVYGWSVSGTVKNSSDGAPISGVAVSVKDSSKYSTTTDNSGNFKLGPSVAIGDSRVIGSSGSYSVNVTRGVLTVRTPRDESMTASLVNCSGRMIWSAGLVPEQCVAKVALPAKLRHGATVLLIRHKNGTECASIVCGVNDNVNISSPQAGVRFAATVANPVILFEKTDYHDTSFTLTTGDMSGVSIVMTPASTQNCPLPASLKWQSSGIIVNIHPDAGHKIVSVKDPTIQKYNGKYLIYCTVYNTSNSTWSMQFIQFDNFSKANDVTPFFMDQVAGFSGYKCAPELFYYEPKKLWYLIWQQQDPAYATTTTPDNPNSWSAPKKFYPNGLGSINLPIDYFPIADDNNFYLFFTGDDGKVYRAKTTLANFPDGFGTPVVVKTLATSIIFEGSSHYKVKGTATTYLHLVEGMGSTGRVYSAWTSEGIEGAWKDYLVGSTTPFAGKNNVTYASGVTDWTDDVSHGELLRDNPNQLQEVDPCHFQLLYQGKDPGSSGSYSTLPYRLGLLTAQ